MSNQRQQYGKQGGTRDNRSSSGGSRDNRGSYSSSFRPSQKNGVTRERFEQGRRESAEAHEARKAAKEQAQEKAADKWHAENVVAFRVPKRFVNVMLTKVVVEVVKDVESGRLKEIKKTMKIVEEVYARDDSDAMILSIRRNPSFQKAFVVVAQ